MGEKTFDLGSLNQEIQALTANDSDVKAKPFPINNYRSNLVNFAIQKYTLEINLANYPDPLEKINDKSGETREQIEKEKSERDRNFQNLVAIIGGGTAIVQCNGL